MQHPKPRGRARRLGVVGVMAAVLSLAAAPEAFAAGTHTVKPGETLSGIASRYGTSVASLAAENGIADPNVILAGSELTIPEEGDSGTASGSAAYPAASSSSSGSVVEVIRNAAGAHGVDPGYLVSVASCESGLDPHAVNPAGYYGLFQFDRQTWAAYGKGSIFDPVAQSNAAAYLVSIGQSERWPVCG